MATGITNRLLGFRPLVGGIVVQNEKVGERGTIGLIAEASDGERWIVSCFHVLCRKAGNFPSGTTEPIFQPSRKLAPGPVAFVDGSRADRTLDVAAAKVVDKAARGRILGLPNLAEPAAPQVGMRVLKAGVKTGVTEGWVSRTTADEVGIIVPPGYGNGYELTDPGDSGAVWVDAETCAPVAMHFRGAPSGVETATARPILLVLSKLKLTVVSDSVC